MISRERPPGPARRVIAPHIASSANIHRDNAHPPKSAYVEDLPQSRASEARGPPHEQRYID